MKYEIRYRPAFASLFVTLEPGESLVAEAGAMASMDSQLSVRTEFFGGFIPAWLKAFFGGESLFVNTYVNRSHQPLQLVLTQSTIGDMARLQLNGSAICFQPGAYIAHTPGVKVGLQWAGFSSWLAREGLFKLKLSGHGMAFYGAYGGLTQKRIDGEFVVDSGHLVAYEPGVQLRVKLAGGLFGSLTSGEGIVSCLKGNGMVYLQSRSMDGLLRFLRPRLGRVGRRGLRQLNAGSALVDSVLNR